MTFLKIRKNNPDNRVIIFYNINVKFLHIAFKSQPFMFSVLLFENKTEDFYILV